MEETLYLMPLEEFLRIIIDWYSRHDIRCTSRFHIDCITTNENIIAEYFYCISAYYLAGEQTKLFYSLQIMQYFTCYITITSSECCSR